MAPYHYKARILPDGHLPLPKGYQGRTGEEVELTLIPGKAGNGEAQAVERSEYLVKTWAGVARGSGSGVAEHHDDHLYDRNQ